MKSDKELLDDTEWDRKIAPRTPASDLLVFLLKNKAFLENDSIDTDSLAVYGYNISDPTIQRLKDEGRIVIKKGRVWLTEIGVIIANGEQSLRNREAQSKS